MFTGLIEELGTIKEIRKSGSHLQIEYEASEILKDVKIGDSISVNGICQTVTTFNEKRFITDISQATLDKTTMKVLSRGDTVNLERAMALGDRIGGHLVQGHVNGIGTIQSIKKTDEMYILSIKIPEDLLKYTIPEGSIAIDGISLTLSSIKENSSVIEIHLIPHSYAKTNLKMKKAGDPVNLETDLFARYIERMLEPSKSNPITEKNLLKWGY